MPPAYRNQNRRQNRTGYVDHDVFEGLPVRQWRRDYTTILSPTAHDGTPHNDIWAIELPHGMPKDSHLLPQHSQDLLRAARSGKIYKRPLHVEEEEVDVEVVAGDKPEKKDDQKESGYTVKTWKPVPRHLEGHDLDYLAKRRKGLITHTSKPANAGPTLTKATVKRIDAAGNEYIQDVVVPQGEKVEGEVISQETIPDPAMGDGSNAPTPIKRKGPPKRKPKGPGRGRKKKPIAPTSAPQLPQVDGAVEGANGANGAVGEDAIKNGTESVDTPNNNEDTEMADGSMHDSDDEEGEDGEDGEEEDEASTDQPGSPSQPPRPSSATTQSTPTLADNSVSEKSDIETDGTEAPARPPMLHIDRERLDAKSGSPLKNIALTRSALTSPAEPSTTAAPPFSDPEPIKEAKPITNTTETSTLDAAMQEEVTATAPTTLPPPPPGPTEAEMEAAVEVRKEEEEEEEMLLDIVENANNAHIGAEEAAPEAASKIIDGTTQSPETVLEATDATAPVEKETIDEPQAEAAQPSEDDDDDFPDLLGGLEKQLNEPIAEPSAAATSTLTGEAALPAKPATAE